MAAPQNHHGRPAVAINVDGVHNVEAPTSDHSRGAGDPIYYEDQADWSDEDYYALWRYFDRLAEYVGPTPAQFPAPGHRSASIQAKKTGVRDEELRAIDLTRMSPESRSLLKVVLVSHQRYALALSKFPNLDALARTFPSVALKGYAQYPAFVRTALDGSERFPEEE